MASILLADDDRSVCKVLARVLRADGHETETVYDGAEALQWLRRYDLAILDIMMPLMNGIDVCRQLKADPARATTSVIFLTARGAIEDKIASFEAGCDDYLVKPFHLGELRLRVRAILRRKLGQPAQTMAQPEVGISLDAATSQVRVDGRTILLTPTEFELLKYMVAHVGHILSTQQLLTEVWGYPPGVGNSGLVRMHIKNLRAKIEPNPEEPRYIQTVARRGYLVSCREAARPMTPVISRAPRPERAPALVAVPQGAG